MNLSWTVDAFSDGVLQWHCYSFNPPFLYSTEWNKFICISNTPIMYYIKEKCFFAQKYFHFLQRIIA